MASQNTVEDTIQGSQQLVGVQSTQQIQKKSSVKFDS